MKSNHELIVGDGTTAFACSCGVRGTYEEIVQHVSKHTKRPAPDLGPSLRSQGFPAAIARDEDYASVIVSPVPTDDDNFGGGNTKAHYLPLEPKKPAPPSHFVEQDPTPAPLPPTPTPNEPIPDKTRSIAELFQDMLRIAYEAGSASAATGEIFETWYQREVLQ